jgi:twitching motility protein PilT
MRLDRDGMLALLRQARDTGSTDLHLKVPGRPAMRVDGSLVPVAGERLNPADTRKAVQALMALASLEFPLSQLMEREFAFGVRGVGRFRACVFRQRGSLSVVVHRMATEVPSLARLGLPEELGELSGMTLVAGNRRRELLAALVDHQNGHLAGHIVLLEDSLEYLHRDRRASISQREVGIDTESWATGIRSGLRQDPDLLVLGELPDERTAAAALAAAEAGHTLLAAVPGSGPAEAIAWVQRLFGPEREVEISARLGEVLTQVLSMDAEGPRRLRMSEDVRDCVRVGAPLPGPAVEAFDLAV